MSSVPERRFDLVAFDVDGTLVTHPDEKTVWQVLNERFGRQPDENRERYRRYLAGLLSYEEWVRLDVSAWQEAGATRHDLVSSLSGLGLIDGTRETLATLKGHGIRLAVISGTIDLLLDTLFPDHPFDEVYTNRIVFGKDGRIESWKATPYDMEGKAEALRTIAAREGVSLSRCAFVGDHENDIPVAKLAGFTVALNPKSKELEAAADTVVHSDDMRAILPHLLDGQGGSVPLHGHGGDNR